MIADLRSWFVRFGKQPGNGAHGQPDNQPTREPTTQLRPSSAVQEFLENIRDQIGLTVLDFSGACEQNVAFITGLRHRLYAESLPKAVESIFGMGSDEDPKVSSPELIQDFLQYSLNFEAASVDAILLWDGLEWLSPDAQRAAVNRVHEILRPGGTALAVFHTDSATPTVPVHHYRLHDQQNLLIGDTGKNRPHRLFTNRNIEMLFERFQSVKFFLSRDQIREVIIRR